MDLQRTTEIIIGIAQEAGAGALVHYGHQDAELKYDGTLVTVADPEAEALIRKHLRAHFPGHSIFGEEMGFEGPEDNPWVWYLDPIDGTSNFTFGIPLWGVSIGLTYEGRCVAGVFEMPALGETYWAWDGGGAYRKGRRLPPHSVTGMLPTDLVAASSTSLSLYDYSFPQKIRCLGSAAYAMAGVAARHFVGLVHENWCLHDIAAGMVMCQEVGLTITREDGTPFTGFTGCNPTEKAPLLVIASPALHPQILAGVCPK